MAYIDTKYLGQCETCLHHRSGKCDTWCDCGEEYKFDMTKIPTADVEEVVRCNDCCFYDIEEHHCREFYKNMPCDGYCSKGLHNERSDT